MSQALKKIGYSHDAMIDMILQDPTVSSSELASLFGYTPAWVSRILASDSFQSRLAQRKSALMDPIIARSLNDRLRAVAAVDPAWLRIVDTAAATLRDQHRGAAVAARARGRAAFRHAAAG